VERTLVDIKENIELPFKNNKTIMEIEKGSKTEPDSTMIGFDKHFKNLQINGKDKENGTPQELSQNHNEKLLEENLLEFTKK